MQPVHGLPLWAMAPGLAGLAVLLINAVPILLLRGLREPRRKPYLGPFATFEYGEIIVWPVYTSITAELIHGQGEWWYWLIQIGIVCTFLYISVNNTFHQTFVGRRYPEIPSLHSEGWHTAWVGWLFVVILWPPVLLALSLIGIAGDIDIHGPPLYWALAAILLAYGVLLQRWDMGKEPKTLEEWYGDVPLPK